MKTRDDMCLEKQRGCFCSKDKGHAGTEHVCICGERWLRVEVKHHPAVSGPGGAK